jgi:hypothetical protein
MVGLIRATSSGPLILSPCAVTLSAAKDLQFAEHREIKKMQFLRRLWLLRMTSAVSFGAVSSIRSLLN